MKKIHALFFALVILLPGTYVGCKKGSGDPGVSFRSRKARMAGDWNVKSYTSSETNTTVTTQGMTYIFKSTFDFDGTTLTETQEDVSLGETQVLEYTASMHYTLGKDGSMTSKSERSRTQQDTVSLYDVSSGNSYDYLENQDIKVVKDETGTWDFLDGVGEGKKKEYVYLAIKTSTETTTYSSAYTALDPASPAQAPVVNTQVDVRDYDNGANHWHIIALKNKSIQVETDYASHVSQTFNGEPSDQDVKVEGSSSFELELE